MQRQQDGAHEVGRAGRGDPGRCEWNWDETVIVGHVLPPWWQSHCIWVESLEVGKQCNDTDREEELADDGAWALAENVGAHMLESRTRVLPHSCHWGTRHAVGLRSCSSANSTARV